MIASSAIGASRADLYTPSVMLDRMGVAERILMGQLTASHPGKALEEGYENRVVAQARLAGARLPE